MNTWLSGIKGQSRRRGREPNNIPLWTIEDSTGHEVVSTSTKYRAYTAFISGLRVSTNYSFEVHPVERMRGDCTNASLYFTVGDLEPCYFGVRKNCF
ncbi:unnamed protein product [Timema podura]|uniref:Uncharacterized protein n=1 Tax=Timema podura TaxID=61482 RepID=A0ABN7P7Q5_TIMPD|nr:unnamed protein product [Timema podura]